MPSTTTRIYLSRPGGQKRPRRFLTIESIGFFSIIVVGLWMTLFFLVIDLKWLSTRQGVWTSLTITILLFIPIALWIRKQFLLERKAFADLFAEIPGTVYHCASTFDGWVACSQDWITSASYPYSIQRIRRDEIANIFWGEPSGRFNRLKSEGDNYPARKSFPKLAPCYWLLVTSRDDSMKSLIMTFRRKAEMEEWLAVAKSIEAGEPLTVNQPASQPTSLQLANKASFFSKVMLVMLLALMCLMGVAVLTFPNTKILPTMNVILFGLCNLGIHFSSKRPEAAAFARNVLVSLKDAERNLDRKAEPFLSHDTLVIIQSISMNGTWVERFQLNELESVSLETGKSTIWERDIAKLFTKAAAPKNSTLRLILNHGPEREREIPLPTDRAEHWYGVLSERIRQERSPA